MQDRSPSYILAVFLSLLGFLLLSSFVLGVTSFDTSDFFVLLFRSPGRFLFESFHVAGLFVPVYLFVVSGMVVRRRFPVRGFLILNLALLPFFTAALFIRLAVLGNASNGVGMAPIVQLMISAFGRTGGLVVALALFLISTVVVLRIGFARRAQSPRDSASQFSSHDEEQASDTELPAQSGDGDPVDDDPAASQVGAAGFASAANTSPPDATGRRVSGYLLDLRNSSVAKPVELVRHDDDEGDDEEDNTEAAEDVRGATAAAESTGDAEVFLLRHGSISELPRDQVVEGFWDDRPETTGGTADTDVFDDAISEEAAFDTDDDGADASGELTSQSAPVPGLSLPEETVSESAGAESAESTEGAIRAQGGTSGRKNGPGAAASRKRPLRGEYKVPIDGILAEYEDGEYWQIDAQTRDSAEVLRYTLEEFQIQAEVTGIRKGPVITMFEILPAPGVKLAKIVNLADNIALRLAASSVRIVAPIPGKHAVGIEIPNKHRAIVSFAELLQEQTFWNSKVEIPIALGKDIPGDAQIVDLAKTPHLLIAGATGSGKSVCVNSIICSILFRKRPDEVKLILIDPKIVELKLYNDIPHLLTPVITEPKRAFQALQYALYEMERRYSLLDSVGVRDIRSYNAKIRQRNLAAEPLPYIVIIVDEFADLMASTGKELESTLARLAAMSRAVGMHLVLATQRPSTDVITGLIKANIPSRIAFMVASKIDSRIIIDAGGAEKLLGRGDMLFTSAWDPFPFRMQGAFLSDEEVERIVTYVKTLGEPEYIDDEIFIDDEDDAILQDDLEDPLMEKAVDIVISAGKASASYLQRRLKIGYNRAARLVEEMERLGVVGPQNGSKPRDILRVPDRV